MTSGPGLGSVERGPLPSQPDCPPPVSGSRGTPASQTVPGEPCGSRRSELQGRPVTAVPWVRAAGAPAPPELPPDLSSVPRDPGARLLLATCVHVLAPLRAPPSVPLLHLCGSCPGVRVSVCLSPCACGSWRRRGVHAGTEPAVGPQRGGQRPDRLTPGPSPRSLVQVRSGATRRPVSFGADADFWEGAGPPQSS